MMMDGARFDCYDSTVHQHHPFERQEEEGATPCAAAAVAKDLKIACWAETEMRCYR